MDDESSLHRSTHNLRNFERGYGFQTGTAKKVFFLTVHTHVSTPLWAFRRRRRHCHLVGHGGLQRRRVIMSPVPVLTYFDAAGRVFGLRACLFKAYGKEGWVDNRVAFKDWRQLKQTTPLGTLPTLTLADGSVMVQTESLARWAAKQAGLYPDDPLEALKVRCVDAASGRNVRPPRRRKEKTNPRGRGELGWTGASLTFSQNASSAG